MKIDTHTHLDYGHPNLSDSVKQLSDQLKKNNFSKSFLIYMKNDPCSLSEFYTATSKNKEFLNFIDIDPKDDNYKNILNKAIKSYNFFGVKLHPRLHNFNLKEKATIELLKEINKLNIPVIIDAFPDGTSLMRKFDLLEYAYIANKFPNINFLWAHMGGLKVLECMLLAKRLKNVFLDISYSLLYFRESSIERDFIYAMKSMKFNKVFYGSDYPDREFEETFESIIKVLENYSITVNETKKLFESNASNFIKLYKK